MKRFIVLMIAAVLLGGAIGGAFIGGTVIGKDQGKNEAAQDLQNRASQFSSRFGQSSSADGNTEQPSDFVPPTGNGTIIGRGTMGTIENIEGNTITVKTAAGTSVNVITSSATAVQKIDTGNVSDLKPGDTISVSGETQDDGTVQAASILISPVVPVFQRP
jgi:hypothetical protein